MSPKSIKKINPNELQLVWSDEHESVYPISYLRDLCPCAGCAGETVLFHQYVPPPPDKLTPGRYELKNIVPVGSYAIQIIWGDRHNTGIYTWEHLLNICPCEYHQRNFKP
ncbi:MAG: DUF971 domain-containing protein [Bacteroidetes bacterium]|nr:MAG: DUF971 domain-containing protein [Bacteroidota bacterium]